MLIAGVAIMSSWGCLGRHCALYQVEPAATPAGSVHVGIVQGNIPGRGIEAMGRARSVTNNHLSETIHLMTKVRLGQAAGAGFPALAGKLDRHRPDSRPAHQADRASRRRGGWSPDSGGRCDARARALTSARPRHCGGILIAACWPATTSRICVPFGEWIPFRKQLLPLIPLLQQVGAQSVPGTRPGVLDVTAGGRPIKVGDVICFELAYDQTIYRSLDRWRPGHDGAEQQRDVRWHRADRAAVRHHPGARHGKPAGNRSGHHEQRVWFHHARWCGRDPHPGVHSAEHGGRDAFAERASRQPSGLPRGWSGAWRLWRCWLASSHYWWDAAIPGRRSSQHRIARRCAEEEERTRFPSASDDEVGGPKRDPR